MMTPVSSELLATVDLEEPISGILTVECDTFESKFRDAAKKADEDGIPERGLVYRLLGAICCFHFKPENRVEPFSNRIGYSDGSRTLVGSDFNKEQIDALHSVVSRFQNVAMRTRVADLVWTRDKSKSDCAEIAIDGYVTMVRSLIDGTATDCVGGSDPTGVAAHDLLTRAIVIARTTGWNKTENDPLRSVLAETLTLAIQKADMAVVRMGQLTTDVRLEPANEILKILPELVESLIEKADFYLAESVQKLVIRRQKIEKIESREAVLKLASIYEAKSEQTGSAMLKASALQDALDSLQNTQGVREERQRLHEKLKDAQLHMFEEMGHFEHSIDISNEVERLLAGYKGLDLLDSLMRLANTERPKSSASLIEHARDEAQKFPLSSLFATSVLDSKGRTVARTGGGTDQPDGLRFKVIGHEKIRMGLAVGAAINPARQWITENFVADLSVFHELCHISPFVPSGMEIAFARGMEAFIYGDDYLAGAALFPVLEAGMRALVASAGRSDTKISVGGIEETIGLGAMLAEHRDVLEEVFGEGAIFCIENLFVHELGPKIRHGYCHGLTRDSQFYSDEYVYAIKLIYSLVLLPLQSSSWADIKAHVQSNIGI